MDPINHRRPKSALSPTAEWWATRLQIAGILLAAMYSTTVAMGATNSVAKNTNAPATAAHSAIDWKRERDFWAFRPPQVQSRPSVRRSDWPRQPLDYFILSAQEDRGLEPTPSAAPRTWFRRVTFDLTGLPPTPEALDQFVRDSQPGARERAVDRLLQSPAFGERLASLWLPLVRYAEDQAHQVGDDSTYFYPNAWKYRQWIIQAFNHDLPYDRFLQYQLAADRISTASEEDLAALGLLGLGPKYYDRGRLEVQAEEWEDRVDTVCRTMLGLTVACARCHDHKFEPITTSDYYALAGIFASTRMVNQRPDGYVEKNNTPASRMQPDTLHIVAEDKPRDLQVFLRGNVNRKGPVAERQFLRILGDDSKERFVDGSGRRELALAISSRGNPLTARVYVNRVWSEFFGKPLVLTPSNFGHSGSKPSHPELLDDLAARFMNEGWSTKKLIREIVLSATYSQDSKAASRLNQKPGEGTVSDPENTWLSRMPRRRLAVEPWRDSLLFVSGELSPAAGASLELTDTTNLRRTVYGRISRLKLDDTLMQFDYPDANVHAEKRSTTTTAMQKLFVLNHPFMLARAEALAGRSAGNGRRESSARIQWLYQTLYGRNPTRAETELAERFIQGSGGDAAEAWPRYAHVLLSSNEFSFVD